MPPRVHPYSVDRSRCQQHAALDVSSAIEALPPEPFGIIVSRSRFGRAHVRQTIRTARFPVISILLLSLVSLVCFGFPMYVIRPFRHQGAGELTAALFIKQIGPWLSAVCVALCLVVAVRFRKYLRSWPLRATTIAAVVIGLLGSVLTHVNVYELMFHPIESPAVQPAQQAKIDGDDMVIAVNMHGEARAYPIREMAYHHIVNDVIAGQPIVSTY